MLQYVVKAYVTFRTIAAPSGAVQAAGVVSSYKGLWRIEFVPREVGNHFVDVMYDGVALNGSPFTSKAYDVSAIQVGQVSNAGVGRLTEFTSKYRKCVLKIITTTKLIIFT